jgi:hypothetical protein
MARQPSISIGNVSLLLASPCLGYHLLISCLSTFNLDELRIISRQMSIMLSNLQAARGTPHHMEEWVFPAYNNKAKVSVHRFIKQP